MCGRSFPLLKLLEMMDMVSNLVKISLVAIALSTVASCAKTDTAEADSRTSTAPVEVAPAESVALESTAVSSPVALVDYDASAGLPTGGSCAIDAINGGPAAGASVKVGSDVQFGGWIADAGNRVPTEARLILKASQNAYSAPLVAGGERPDVAAALGAEPLALSGYNVLAKMDVAPGTYELSIVHGVADAATSCVLNASLIVTN